MDIKWLVLALVGALLIEGFSGDFNNVVGLPVIKLAEELAKIVPEDDNGA